MRTIGKGSLASFLARLLDLTWYGTGILVAGAVCFLLITPWVDPPRIQIGLAVPVAFTVNTDVHARGDDVVNAYLKASGGALYYSPRSPAAAAGGMATLIAVLAFAMFIVGQLRGVFRTLRDGQPFIAANAIRLRRVGWAFIFGSIAWTALAYAGSRYASTHFVADAVRLDTRVDINGAAIVGGLIILVIAEVFREGTRLDEDQSLTV